MEVVRFIRRLFLVPFRLLSAKNREGRKKRDEVKWKKIKARKRKDMKKIKARKTKEMKKEKKK